jgi:hypothetical protein
MNPLRARPTRGRFGEEWSVLEQNRSLPGLAEAPEVRAPFIAYRVPKTFDPANEDRLTRELLLRFGHIETVCRVMQNHFRCDGWSGLASEYFRRRRDEAAVGSAMSGNRV